MDVLAEIRQKLLSGKQPVALVKEGYAKSSVYHVANKLCSIDQIKVWGSETTGDEVQGLRRRKEIIKLEREIAELEAAKERLPERVSKLEAEVHQLRQRLPDLVANCFTSLFALILCKHGCNQDEALEETKSIGNDFLEIFWASH